MYRIKKLKALYKETFGESTISNKKTIELELYKVGALKFNELSKASRESINENKKEDTNLTEPETPLVVEATTKAATKDPIKRTTPLLKGRTYKTFKIKSSSLNKYIGGFVYSGTKGDLIDVADIHVEKLLGWDNIEKV